MTIAARPCREPRRAAPLFRSLRGAALGAGLRRTTPWALALLGVAAGATAAELQGTWGGDRLQLTVEAQGAIRLQSDCASGRIAGPVAPGADGRFEADGQFDDHVPGPQAAGPAAASRPAKFSGRVQGGVLTLSIVPQGAQEARTFTLREGVRVKLVLCR